MQETREKKVTKLQQFETYEEVPQVEAEAQGIFGSRFVDKREESGELRSRLVSRGYESSQADPATRIALVLGMAQDLEMAVADISGGKHFFMRYWTNISLSHRQLSTGNQVLCGRQRDGQFLLHECESGVGADNRNGCHLAVRWDSHYFCSFAQVL